RPPAHAHPARRRRGAGEAEGGLETAPAALLTRLRPAVPRSRAAGQRGMRLRLPARQDTRALRGFGRPVPRVSATSRSATAPPGRGARWGTFERRGGGTAGAPRGA